MCFKLLGWLPILALPAERYLNPLNMLLFELHLLIKEILTSKKPIQNSFDIAHPIQSHLHLQILVLQQFLLLLKFIKTSFLLFQIILMLLILLLQNSYFSRHLLLLILLLISQSCYVFLLPLQLVIPSSQHNYILLN